MTKITYPYRALGPWYIGEAIKDARKQKSMKQEDLANLTGTSVKFISNVERGKETVQLDKVFDLLRAVGLSIYLTQGPLEDRNG